MKVFQQQKVKHMTLERYSFQECKREKKRIIKLDNCCDPFFVNKEI